jgi:hypothetical protein
LGFLLGLNCLVGQGGAAALAADLLPPEAVSAASETSFAMAMFA